MQPKFQFRTTSEKDSAYLEGIERGRVIVSFLDSLLPKFPDAVLDAGCGQGGISLAFAEKGVKVSALDFNLNSLKAARSKSQPGSAPSADFLRASATGIPFISCEFDMVVMNGVLEWLPVTDNRTSPEAVQRHALADVWRVIKPDGHFYLAIENRYFAGYFLGLEDPHAELLFSSILPRRLADIYSRLVKKKPYRPYIYSLRGLKRLLQGAGFEPLGFYTGLPSYQFPNAIVAVGDSRAMAKAAGWAVTQPLYRAALKAMALSRTSRLFTPNFIVVSQKRDLS